MDFTGRYAQGFFQDFLLGPFLQRRLSLAEQLWFWGGFPPPLPHWVGGGGEADICT
jgi:hypothetical protein